MTAAAAWLRGLRWGFSWVLGETEADRRRAALASLPVPEYVPGTVVYLRRFGANYQWVRRRTRNAANDTHHEHGGEA